MAQLSQEEKAADVTGQDGEASKNEQQRVILMGKADRKEFGDMVDLNENYNVWLIKSLHRMNCEGLFAEFLLMNGYRTEDGNKIFLDVNDRSSWHFFASFGSQVLPGMFKHE